MATNVGQRNVPNTPQTAQCYAVDSALDLACHTLKLCKNHNIFEDDYVELRDKIIDTAVRIHNYSYTANRIRVESDYDWQRRSLLQEESISLCNEMLGYINLSKRVYHLRKGKTEFWANKTLETRNLLSKWHQADAKRYSGT